MTSSMKTRSVPENVLPLDVDGAVDDDQRVLGAVLEHYSARLFASPELLARLSVLSCTAEVAERFGVGVSDRTIGLRLPDRQWKAGRILRGRLCDLGVLRDSGHESFRGCLVVPVKDPEGSVTALYGRRVDGSGRGIWAERLPGGIFNEQAMSGETLVIVSCIEDALAVACAGHDEVIAPGRPKGFSRRDLTAIAKVSAFK